MIVIPRNNKIRNAVIAGLISGLYTLIVTLYAIIAKPEGLFSYFNDPWLFLDVSVILGLTYGIYRRSRSCAILMFIYYLLSKVIISIDFGRPVGLIFGIVFLYIFFEGIRGTFTYHKKKLIRGEVTKKPRTWVLVLAISGVSLFLLLATLGILGSIGYLPDTKALKSDEISPYQLNTLKEMNIGLHAHEEIIYFYSFGFLSIKEGGSLFTNKRVISYENIDGKLSIYSASFEEIKDIVFARDGDFIEDSIITIFKKDGESFFLDVSVEEERDKEFYNLLVQQWKSK